jgi:hypothetical protein
MAKRNRYPYSGAAHWFVKLKSYLSIFCIVLPNFTKVIGMTRKYTISDEARQALSQRMKRLNADPKFVVRREAASREESRTVSSARMKRLNADPKFKAAASKRLKKLHADPKFAAKLIASTTTPEFRAGARTRMKERLADPKFAEENAATARENLKRANLVRQRKPVATPPKSSP